MRLSLKPGSYVAAVSGGVDSMVLLDVLRQRPGIKLTVAHFDHGIRETSDEDRKLVQRVAREHRLPFVFARGNLGSKASEATARTARYNFLRSVQKASGARGIITAHHQDDMLETAILNMLRGSGHRGLVSLKSTDGISRPLLGYTKDRLYDYAKTHHLAWNEDHTNTDERYLRNHIRQRVTSRLSAGQRAQLVILLDQLTTTSELLQAHITNLLHTQPALHNLERGWFIALPHDISRELTHQWLTRSGVANINHRRIEQLVVAMKTAHPGTMHDVDQHHILRVNKHDLALMLRDR